MTGDDNTIYHATGVAIHGHAVLITGASGVGKSELALMLMDRGAVLISDDQVLLEKIDDRLFAAPAPHIAGRIEVRNLGILTRPYVSHVPVALHIALRANAPRWIDKAERATICGVSLPTVTLFPATPALAVKVELALQAYGDVT